MPSMSIHQHQIEQVQLNKTIEQKTDWAKVNWSNQPSNKNQLIKKLLNNVTIDQISSWTNRNWAIDQLTFVQLSGGYIVFQAWKSSWVWGI